MTFRHWLNQQVKRGDPVGDLARDVRADPCGARLRSPKSIWRHIEDHGYCDGAEEAFLRARDEWHRFTH